MKLGLAAIASALCFSMSQAGPALSAPDAALFGQLPQAHDAAISPNGNQLAILQNHQGSYLVNVVDLDGSENDGRPKVVTLGEGVQPDFIKWIDDHRIIGSSYPFGNRGCTGIR